jgi:magnesium chelatase family protein
MSFLQKVFSNLDFSARAYDKILRVSRTIADLAGDKDIEAQHVAQAVQYRSLDRKFRMG